MKNIAVIGAGTMGNGIAHTFAQFGYSVNLIDISKESLEKGLKTITESGRLSSILCPLALCNSTLFNSQQS